MSRLFATLGILTLAVAGQAFAQEDNVDPVGTYNWEVNFQGQIVTGTFEVTGSEGDWTGESTSDVGNATITAVEVSGNEVVLTIDAADMGEITIELMIDGDEFTGFGMVGFDEFTITGTKTST